MNKIVLIMVALLWLCVPVGAGNYVIVVNKTGPLSAISAADLKRVFTGKITDFGGIVAVPVAYDLNIPASVEFLTEILDMKVTEYRSFWMAQQVKGTGNAPSVQKTPEGVIDAVAAAPGGIGFIEKDKVTDAVKVIPVK
jgi:ABC-type phosphate transport system substrate-binding protein